MSTNSLKLLPRPRHIVRREGHYSIPARAALYLEADLDRETVLLPVAQRIQSAGSEAGVDLELVTGSPTHPRLAIKAQRAPLPVRHPEAYSLNIGSAGVAIQYCEPAGLRAAAATLRQLLREFGRRLPNVRINDHPDFAHRGVMLDISRGRVPRIETLLELTSQLADFKINEFQLYIEHTFAYRNYEPVWRDWGALTGEEILKLDAHCRKLGIELVPNQNSFGHLRYWLEYPPLHKLAEIDKPWPDQGGTFLRRPTTLAPFNPSTLPFLRELYDELLPCFTSRRFNVGCDETWDLGRGQSKRICQKRGKGRVYLDFLKKIHREVSSRGMQMMFWGDILLHYPELVREVPSDAIALNWGYEADHPFERESRVFAKAQLPFYTCPGTSTWMSLIGRHDTAFINLRRAAKIGLRHGACGYLNTDWGDGGHPQPLAVSYLPYLLGAAVSWFDRGCQDADLVHVANRDIFHDPSGNVGRAALALGFAHKKFRYVAPNVTPFGAVIAAPKPESLELFCRDGLKYYARIPSANIRAALEEVAIQRAALKHARPKSAMGRILAEELDIAARMASQSCQYMLWQQALASGKHRAASAMAKSGIKHLRQLDADFRAYWPTRNRGTTTRSTPFLQWRIREYHEQALPFPPDVAAAGPMKANPH